MKGARARRWTTLFVIAVSTALMATSISVALHWAREQFRLESVTQRVSVWHASQALVEVHRLHGKLLQLGDAGVADHAQLMERYEILLSRVALLSPDNVEASEGLHDQLNIMPWLMARLEALEPMFLAYRPDQTENRRALTAVLDQVEAQLSQLYLTLHRARAAAIEAAEGNAARLSLVLTFCIAGLTASGGLLIVLLRRGMRRATETERTLRVLVDALPVAVTAVDTAGRFVLANGAARRLYRLAEDEEAVIGRRAHELGAASWLEEDAAAVLAERRPRAAEERTVATADGGERTLMTTAAPVLSSRADVVRVVSVGLDVTERRAADRQIRFLAQHDPLTALPNRASFTAALRQAVAQLDTAGFVAVHCLDLDNFKHVNDSLGHPIGDRLLVAAAERMRAALRPADLLARLGGDEFAVIQPSIPGAWEASATAERLVQVLAEPFRIEGYTLRSGGSVGTALAPLHGVAVETLLQRADIALYRAKAAGRGRSRLFSPQDEQSLLARRDLEDDLHRAVAAGTLSVVYQPKIRLRDAGMAGCEALLRWRHPTRGWVPPSQFIPVAEETGLIQSLTSFVLEQACRQTMAWRSAGLTVPVAINLSAADFSCGQGVGQVHEALRITGADPQLLEIEVTEGVFLRSADAASQFLGELRAMGVRTALDDFGTGYSSLVYLQHLPFDVIKIDRQFVSGIDRPGPARHIVDAVVRLAHGLSAQVVAEGVESMAQFRTLAALDCDMAQGFLLARPMAPAALAEAARQMPWRAELAGTQSVAMDQQLADC